MSTLLDTNIIISLLDDTCAEHQACLEMFEGAKENGPVIISDIVYSELTIGMPDQGSADEAVASLSLSRLAYSDETLFRAGRAFKAYKDDNKGPKNNVLSDFLVGAQAEVMSLPLLTSDAKRIKTYFPAVEVLEP